MEEDKTEVISMRATLLLQPDRLIAIQEDLYSQGSIQELVRKVEQLLPLQLYIMVDRHRLVTDQISTPKEISVLLVSTFILFPLLTPASFLSENIEENMQRVRESVYNRKKGLYSEVPISHAGRHTPTMPHPPHGKPGVSREVSPAPGGYPQ